MTSDRIGREIEQLFEAGASRLTLDDLSEVEASRPGPSRSSRLALAAGASVVLGLGTVLAVVTGTWPGTVGRPGETCLPPPVEELAMESPVPMRLEPNPVPAGAEAVLTVDGPVGVPARWQCWDGDKWVDTHYLMRGWSDGASGALDVVELGPDVTVTWPAVGLAPSEPYPIRVPEVPAGFYRIEDEVIDRGSRLPAFTIVQVVEPVAPPDPVETTTTTADPGTTTLLPEAENVPIDVGPLTPRGGHSVVWSGSEMIIWGGAADENSRTQFDDGAAFNPATNSWRMISPSPLAGRMNHHAAWTGSEMLIVSGRGRRDGAAYDPVSDTWRQIADAPFSVPYEWITEFSSSVWIGDRLVVWDVQQDAVAAYSPQDERWEMLPPVGIGAVRGVLRWTGRHLIALGIDFDGPGMDQLEGARFDGLGWAPIPSPGSSSIRPMLSAWAGSSLIVWEESGWAFSFEPDEDQWTRLPAAPQLPGCEGLGEPLELGGEGVLLFEWCGDDIHHDSRTGTWSTVRIDGHYGDARWAVWTGSEVLLWGDTCCFGTAGEPFAVRAWRWIPPN